MLFAESKESVHPISQDRTLRIEGANGSVVVRATDRTDLLVRAEVNGTSRERAQAARISVREDDAGRAIVSIDWPDGREEPEAAVYEIEAPRNLAGLEVETTVGTVSATDLGGPARIITTVGEVFVINQAGGVDASTTNARVSVQNPGGPVKVRTANGVVTAIGAPGPVDVETSNAGVEVRLTDDSRGPVRVVTAMAVVQLDVGPAFAGLLRMRTTNAPVEIDPQLDPARITRSGRSQASVDFGPGQPSDIVTSGGTIGLKARSR